MYVIIDVEVVCGFHCSAWLYDEHHPTIHAITNRIAAITHLDMETVEPLQVVNYGIGGQYEPHFDMSRVGIIVIFCHTVLYITVLGNMTLTIVHLLLLPKELVPLLASIWKLPKAFKW